MARGTITIIQGENTDAKQFTFKQYPTLDSNWTGRVAVKKELGTNTTDIINKAMERDVNDTMLIGYLSPTETSTIEPGNYYITYEIQNLSLVPQLNKEYQYKLVVLEQGA